MSDIILSCVMYGISFVAQLLLHRELVKRKRRTLLTNVTYVFGFTVLLIVLRRPAEGIRLPFASILLYLELCAVTFILLITPLLGEKGPTGTLLEILHKGPASFKELELAFDKKDFVDNRLRALIHSGLIKEDEARLTLTEKGKAIVRLITWYKNFLGWRGL